MDGQWIFCNIQCKIWGCHTWRNKSWVSTNRLKKIGRWVFPRPAWYFPCLWRPSCGCHTCVTRHKHNFNTSGLQEVHLETFFEMVKRQGVVCYLFPGRRSREGEVDASLQVIAFHSYEEEDFVLKKRKTFFILSERNTSSFSFSRIRRFRLLHSQEEKDFISSKRRTLLDLVSHLSRVRTLPHPWLQRQVTSSLKKSKAAKAPQLCWCSSSIKL